MKKILIISLAIIIILFGVGAYIQIAIMNQPLSQPQKLVFSFEDREFTFKPEELGISYEQKNRLFQKPILLVNFDEAKLDQALAELSKEINKEPEDAKVSLTDGIFKIDDEKIGYQVLLADFKEKIKGNALNTSKLPIPFEEIQPQLTAEEAKNLLPNDLLASYTTTFTKNINRTENIKVASKNLNGHLIAPGETFSFNQVVGQRTVDQGYKEALVIIQGKFVPGLAGGICQVSSTIYNALLLADIQIVERWPHSLKVSYVPLGRDATVNYGLQDLKFMNNTGAYLLIKNSVTSQALTFSIYGKGSHMDNKKITLQTTIQATIAPKTETIEDTKLPYGKKVVETNGQAGYRTTTYLHKTENGVKTTRKLSSDYYKPLSQVIRVGTSLEPDALMDNDTPPENIIPEQETLGNTEEGL